MNVRSPLTGCRVVPGCTVKSGAPTACRCTCVRKCVPRVRVSQCTVLTCPRGFLSLVLCIGGMFASFYHCFITALCDVPRGPRGGSHRLPFERAFPRDVPRNCSFEIVLRFLYPVVMFAITNVYGGNLSTCRRYPGAYYRRRQNVAGMSRDQRRGPSRSPVARCFPLRRRLSNVSGPALAVRQQVPVGSDLGYRGGRGHERYGAATSPFT